MHISFLWVLYDPAYILLQINIVFPTDLGTDVSQDREYSLLIIWHTMLQI